MNDVHAVLLYVLRNADGVILGVSRRDAMGALLDADEHPALTEYEAARVTFLLNARRTVADMIEQLPEGFTVTTSTERLR